MPAACFLGQKALQAVVAGRRLPDCHHTSSAPAIPSHVPTANDFPLVPVLVLRCGNEYWIRDGPADARDAQVERWGRETNSAMMLPQAQGVLRLAVRASPRQLLVSQGQLSSAHHLCRFIATSVRTMHPPAASGALSEGKKADEMLKEGAAAAPLAREKKIKCPKPARTPVAPTRPLPSFIDLRVGKIIDIERHPNADTLYVEKVDFGEDEPRTVLSGLVNNVPIEALKGRIIVGVCNLKPVSMRGMKSHGMLLCAIHKDGDDAGVEPVYPPAGSKPGDRIWVDGYEDMQPKDQLNPKKKVFEAIQPYYLTTDEKVCAWRGIGPNEDPAIAKPRIRIIQAERGPLLAHFEGASLA